MLIPKCLVGPDEEKKSHKFHLHVSKCTACCGVVVFFPLLSDASVVPALSVFHFRYIQMLQEIGKSKLNFLLFYWKPFKANDEPALPPDFNWVGPETSSRWSGEPLPDDGALLSVPHHDTHPVTRLLSARRCWQSLVFTVMNSWTPHIVATASQ